MLWLPLVSGVSAVLGVVGVLTAAFVIARSAAMRAAAEAWRGEAEAQKARADRLDSELQALTRRVDHLELVNEHLREITSGVTAIAALDAKLDMNFEKVLYLIAALSPGTAHA